MLIYLDNCCFNRPFDVSDNVAIRLETDAKLFIQTEVLAGKFDLAWSFILHYENNDNPFIDRKEQIFLWQSVAKKHIPYSDGILEKAKNIMDLGVRQKDAYHIASALDADCKYFITTDKKLLNKNIEGILIINPIDFVRRIYDEK